MALAAVLKYEDDEVRVFFTFHRATIEGLKALRVGARWDKDGEFWAAPQEADMAIAQLLDALGYVWEIAGASSVAPQWSDVLFERAPSRLRSSLFRAVAHVVHPDHDGDESMMRELTDSWRSVSQVPA